MPTSWDKFQELVKAEMLKTFSPGMVEHSMNPRNIGHIEDANAFGRVTGPCGDTMSIWIKVENGVITNLSFLTDGCGTTIASGSMITELAKGKDISAAERIEQQDVLDALGGLPEENEHCALLASTTLKEAVRNYRDLEKGASG